MTKTTRHIAFDILFDVHKNKSYANLTMKEKLSGINAQDAAFITNIVYGVLKNQILIDYYIDFYTKGKKVKPNIREILRISIYQMLFMDKVPSSAAINESVNLTKKLKMQGLSGFVNGVLRNFSRNIETLPEITGDFKQKMSIKYSHPLFLVNKLLENYSKEETEQILISNNEKAEIVCRINTLKTDFSGISKKISDVQFEKSEIDENILVLSKTGDLTRLDVFKNGEIYVQDFASQLAIKALNPTPDSTLIDVCSAPGGKSFLSAILMENKGEIHSFDIHKHKIELISKTAEKMDISIIKPSVFDANNAKKELLGKADFVICDVPCSGLGIIRRKPEIRFKEDISSLPEIQLNILKSASKYVKSGGFLIYSTCTIIKDENEDVIMKFLAENNDFELEEFEILGKKQSFITLLPHKNNTDGFFISKIKRK